MYDTLVSTRKIGYVSRMTQGDINMLRTLVQHHVEKEGLRPFARRIGLPVGVIRSIQDGRDVGVSNLLAACERLGFEFYIGPKRDVGPPDPVRPMPGDARIGEEEYSLIARYEVNVSAGAGLIPTSEEVEGRLAFSRSWLIRHQISPDLAGLVKVSGDSMFPTIPDGALVLVNCAEMRVEREGIFAFSREGEAFIKRLLPVDREPDGWIASMVIMSDNPKYPPEVVTGPALNEIRIVGRIRSILIDV